MQKFGPIKGIIPFHLDCLVQYVAFLSPAANFGVDALSRGLVTKNHELYPNSNVEMTKAVDIDLDY